MVKKRHVPSVSDAIFGTPKMRTVKNPLNISLPSIHPSQTRKDSRRSFTQTQKNAILVQQNGKCAMCYRKLDPIVAEYDHKKSWASGGKTIIKNGRALCANCHKKTTHEARLKRVDKKRKPKNTNLLF